LGYDYGALEPHIDARTMEIHHTKHHKTYTDKLNEALEKHPELQQKSDELLRGINRFEDIFSAVRNHRGATTTWPVLAGARPAAPEPAGDWNHRHSLWSFDDQAKLTNASASAVPGGSGWWWAATGSSGDLDRQPG
jgi:Fe-Mn family superoxide dismutase